MESRKYNNFKIIIIFTIIYKGIKIIIIKADESKTKMFFMRRRWTNLSF